MSNESSDVRHLNGDLTNSEDLADYIGFMLTNR